MDDRIEPPELVVDARDAERFLGVGEVSRDRSVPAAVGKPRWLAGVHDDVLASGSDFGRGVQTEPGRGTCHENERTVTAPRWS